MKIFLTKVAQKQKLRIPKSELEKVEKQLIHLKKNPLSGKKLLGDYAGTRAIRAWPYRIVYYIKKPRNEIWVVSILHRQGAYK